MHLSADEVGKYIVTSDVVFYEQHFPWKSQASPEQAIFSINPPNTSTEILNCFSGPYDRPDGLSAALRQRGYTVLDLDNSPKFGDKRHDILNDNFFNKILTDASNKRFRAIFAAPPCSTFSVSRFFDYGGEGSKDCGSQGHGWAQGRHLDISRRSNKSPRSSVL